MGARIAIVGTGAVGGYAGAHMAQAGEDVTFVDFWPENVETIRAKGLRISHLRDVPEFTTAARVLHVTELQRFSKERPIDIAFICTKSYDTAWATMMIRQYLAPGGFVVSLQNCMNEETIAGVVNSGTSRRWLMRKPVARIVSTFSGQKSTKVTSSPACAMWAPA